MANQKDLVVKMTINDKDFQNGLQNAKQSVKNFDKNSGLGALTKKIGALGIAMKAVDFAKDTFIKGINSTEQSADKAASSMRSLHKSYDAVIQSLSNSNTGMSLTIDNLAMIAKNAKAAYEALDKLSTFQMWSSADRSIINAQIAEDRVIVNSKTASAEEKKAAQGRIDANIQRLNGLTQQYLTNTKNAQVAVLREMGKASQDVTDEMLSHYVDSWKSGTLEKEAQQFWEKNAKTVTRSIPMSLGDQTWQQEQTYTIWSSPQAEAQYQSMRSLINARETEEGWAEYFKLVKEEGQIRTEIANTVNKANKASQKELETHKSGGGGAKFVEGLNLDQQVEYLNRALQNELLNDEHLKDLLVLEIDIPEEEIFEPETEALIKAFSDRWKEATERIEAFRKSAEEASMTLSAFSGLFAGLSNLAADGSPWQKFASAISGVLSEINGLISTYSSLVAIEAVAESIKAGNGIPFPYNLIAIAAAGSALVGIIATLKGSFQDAGSFATGGIVGGNSYTGDRLIAHVNSGEMILNRSQQMALFGRPSDDIHFIIEGSQLKGVLDNYNKTEAL